MSNPTDINESDKKAGKPVENSSKAHTEADKSISEIGRKVLEIRKRQHESGKSGVTDKHGLNSAKDILGDFAHGDQKPASPPRLEADKPREPQDHKTPQPNKFEAATQQLLETACQRFGRENVQSLHIRKDDISSALSALLLGPDACKALGPAETSKFGKRLIVFGIAPAFGMSEEAHKRFSKENSGGTAKEGASNFAIGTALGAVLEKCNPWVTGAAILGGGTWFMNDQLNSPEHKARNAELNQIASKVDNSSNEDLANYARRTKALIGPDAYNGLFMMATGGAGLPEGQAAAKAGIKEEASALGKIDAKGLAQRVEGIGKETLTKLSEIWDRSFPKQKAEAMAGKAVLAEENISPDLCGLAAKYGGEMKGLAHRFKSADSMERKIADEGASKINDALRYTTTFPPDKLASGANQMMDQLDHMGYKKLTVKNTFVQGKAYMGINTTFSKDGQVFELQFHTPQSLEVKEGLNHKLYEAWRELFKSGEMKPSKDLIAVAKKFDEYLQEHGYRELAKLGKEVQSGNRDAAQKYAKALSDQMKANSETIEIPPNVDEVKTFDITRTRKI